MNSDHFRVQLCFDLYYDTQNMSHLYNFQNAENHEYSKVWICSNIDHILVHNWSAQKSKRLIFKKWSIVDDHVTDLMVDFRLIIYEEHLRVRLLSILMIQRNDFLVKWNIIAKINCKEILKRFGEIDFYWEYGNFWTILSDR